MKTKKLSERKKTAQEFVNIQKIENNLLYSNDGFIYGYIWVKAKNSELLTDDEQQNFITSLSLVLETEKKEWQLISLPRIVDTTDLVSHLFTLRRNTKNEAKLNLLNEEIASLQVMAREGLREPLIYIKLWEKIGKKAEQDINKRIIELESSLNGKNINATKFDDKDISYVCKIFADLGEHQNREDDVEEYVPTIGKTTKRKKKNTQDNTALLSMLTPVGGLTFKTNQTIIGATIGKIYGAIRYPSSLSYMWAVKMVNCTEAITCITYSLSNSNELAEALSTSIKHNLTEANSTKDVRQQKAYEKKAEDADKMISSLDEKGEAIGRISIIVMPFTKDEDMLDDVCKRVISVFNQNRIKMKVLGQLQKEGFKMLSPYYTPNEYVLNITQRIMPLSTFVGGQPMTVNVFKDDNGLYFAKSFDGGIIAIDFDKRGGDRTNGNIVITGKAGTGKSTAIKHIQEILFMLGYKIIVVDPEREYKDLCKNLDGVWLDAGGGNAKMNVLQVKKIPEDDEEEQNELFKSITNPLALQMKTLEIFFNTYIPSLTDINRALLKKTLIELYANFGIVWETDIKNVPNDKYPIIKDLYDLIAKYAKTDKAYAELGALLYDMAMGSDSFLWNGYTNINTDNNFVCFDTYNLNNSSDQIKRTQYFNILTTCWDIMSKDREEKVALFCDEAYLMVDPNVPQSLMFLRNIEKRCRKYNGILGIISHSIVDFLDEKIKAYGQALLEMPTYKIFFGTDGQNLKETTELYNLSEAEQEVLRAGIQREALAFFGSQRVKIKFDLPEYKLKYMGKGGGR